MERVVISIFYLHHTYSRKKCNLCCAFLRETFLNLVFFPLCAEDDRARLLTQICGNVRFILLSQICVYLQKTKVLDVCVSERR